MVGTIISFILLSTIKILATLLWRFDVDWPVGPRPRLNQIKLMIFLNHTSLFEPVFLAVVSFADLWFIARRMVAPGANKTLDRPIVGRLYKFLFPHMVSITRKRDFSWDNFLHSIENDSLIVIAPEGRMKRRNGLDADGKPMSVRGGVADILAGLGQGKILFVYSGGLHHVQAPGERKIHFFKTIKVKLEVEDISSYKQQFPLDQADLFKAKIIDELNRRLQIKIPA